MSEEGAAEIVKGDTFKKSQRCSEAASCYEKAFRMNPGEPGPLIKKIGALLLAGDSEDAMDDAFDAGNRLVEHFPDSAAAYEARGRLLAHCNQHDDAVVDFAAALELDPNSIEAYKGRGFSLIALGRHKEAAKMYGRASGRTMVEWVEVVRGVDYRAPALSPGNATSSACTVQPATAARRPPPGSPLGCGGRAGDPSTRYTVRSAVRLGTDRAVPT